MSDTYKFSLVDDEGWEVEFEIPAKYEVCDRCNGRGKHDHPAFSNGLTQSDFDEDPDFREEYMRGRYDVPCSECHGLRVVLVPDRERCTPDQITNLDMYENIQAEIASERAFERRMRSMGCEW